MNNGPRVLCKGYWHHYEGKEPVVHGEQIFYHPSKTRFTDMYPEEPKKNNHDPKGESGALKDPLHLIPSAATRPTSRVLRLGAGKYGQWNFRDNKVCLHTYIAAMKRHIEEFWDEGLDKDEESGEHPLAHVIASAMIVLDAIKHGTLIDNRWKPSSQQA